MTWSLYNKSSWRMVALQFWPVSCVSLVAGQSPYTYTMPCQHLFTSAMFWCPHLRSDEWKETDVDMSYLWQTRRIQQAHHWWVSSVPFLMQYMRQCVREIFVHTNAWHLRWVFHTYLIKFIETVCREMHSSGSWVYAETVPENLGYSGTFVRNVTCFEIRLCRIEHRKVRRMAFGTLNCFLLVDHDDYVGVLYPVINEHLPYWILPAQT